MSEILGLGINQYRLYESGEMPTESIGKTIKSISDPNVFKVFVENAQEQFSENEFAKIKHKLELCHPDNTEEHRDIFGSDKRSLNNGYALQSVAKLKNLLLFFISHCSNVSRTKMNKLLFFADFLCYKEYGFGISGLQYIAINFGPVPDRWRSIYSHFDDIIEDIKTYGTISWEELVSDKQPDMSMFSEQETTIITTIAEKFRTSTATALSALSHKEKAWIDNVNNGKAIEYSLGFDLRGVSI